MAESTPVGSELFDDERLLHTGAEPQMNGPWRTSTERRDRVGVKTQLQYVTWLPLGAGQFGVDRFVEREVLVGLVHAYQEVGDAANALVDEGHLKDDVIVSLQGVADARHPGVKGLARITPRYVIDRLSLVLEVGETIALVLRTLLDEQVSE